MCACQFSLFLIYETKTIFKWDTLKERCPQHHMSASCYLDSTWCRGLFSGGLLCLRPGSVKHISVFLHAIMQNMHVIATESVLSELCYCNVSIKKSQQTSSGPGTHFSIGPGEVPLGEIRTATAATSLIRSSVFKWGLEWVESARVPLCAWLNIVRTGKTVLMGPGPPHSVSLVPQLLSTDFTDPQKPVWGVPKPVIGGLSRPPMIIFHCFAMWLYNTYVISIYCNNITNIAIIW